MHEPVEVIERMTIPLMSTERESGNIELIIDVRIYEDFDHLEAEPIAYHVVGGLEELHGKRPREWDALWAVVRMAVDSEYTPSLLEDIALEYPDFENVRRVMKQQIDSDNAWHQRAVL